MYGLTTAAVLQVALLATGASEYQEAYNRAEQEGKPLLVLVGTDTNADCRTMQQETLPELMRSGGLNNIVYTELDSDAKPDLARQFLRGDTQTQLVLYTQVGKLWRRTHISGAQSQSEIRAFLEREIAKGLEVAEKVRKGEMTVTPITSNVIYTYSTGGS